MQLCQRLADRAAVDGRRTAWPHAFEEGDDRRRAPGKVAAQAAVIALHRQRAGDVAPGAMYHQAEEERQLVAVAALCVERQDVGRLGRVQQEVRVFRALRDALVGQQIANVVIAQECAKLLLGDVGVDGHVGQAFPLTKAMSAAVSSTSRNTRLTGKFSVSSAVTASSTATSKRSRKALMISSTISSGAEAPADRPR